MNYKKVLYALVGRVSSYFNIVKHLLTVDHMDKLGSASVMLVSHDADRGLLFNGTKYSQLIDSINDRLISIGIEALTIIKPFSTTSVQNYGRVVNINGMMARAIVADKIYKLIGKKSKYNANYKIKAWSLIISRVKPRLIIGIQPSAELCIVAKSEGIWIADMQHGVISSEGYYGLAYRENYNQDGWPSCVLCWNTASKLWIESEVGSYTAARVVGNPWFLRFFNPLEDDCLVSALREKVEPLGASRVRILITLQWGMNRFQNYNQIGMPIALLDFIKQRGNDIDWWIRVHPLLFQDSRKVKTFSFLEHEFLGYENVYWENSTNLPLPLILSETDLHVTSSSAVTIEAGWFGIQTALLGAEPELLKEWFCEEINNGIAEIISPEGESIAKWIEKNIVLSKEHGKFCMDNQLLDDFIQDIQSVVCSATLDPGKPTSCLSQNRCVE